MITPGVRDLAAAVRLYEEGLGFPRMASPPEVPFFTLEGSWPGLYGRDALAVDATLSPQGTGLNHFALAHNVGTDDLVGQVINQAVSAGANLTKKPGKVFLGGYSGYFKDPDGHLREVAHNPFSGSDHAIHVHDAAVALPGK